MRRSLTPSELLSTVDLNLQERPPLPLRIISRRLLFGHPRRHRFSPVPRRAELRERAARGVHAWAATGTLYRYLRQTCSLESSSYVCTSHDKGLQSPRMTENPIGFPRSTSKRLAGFWETQLFQPIFILSTFENWISWYNQSEISTVVQQYNLLCKMHSLRANLFNFSVLTKSSGKKSLG